MRILSTLKNIVVRKGIRPQKVRFGMLKGLEFNLDLTNQSQTVFGLAEFELNSWFRKYSQGVRTALDVGAAFGYYTMFFLSRTSAEQVYAFEPGDACAAELNSNLKLNGLADTPRFHLSRKFVGCQENDEWTTLDSLIDVIHTPCIVKLDIEGGELDALRGASKLLKLPNVRWIIEVHSQQLETQCKELLESSGYRVYPATRSLLRILVPEQRQAGYNSWIVAEND